MCRNHGKKFKEWCHCRRRLRCRPKRRPPRRKYDRSEIRPAVGEYRICKQNIITITIRGYFNKENSHSVYTITSGKKGQITVMECANASGVVLPPGIMFKEKKENKIIITSAPASWSIQFSEKVWMTLSTFLVWLIDVSIA